MPTQFNLDMVFQMIDDANNLIISIYNLIIINYYYFIEVGIIVRALPRGVAVDLHAETNKHTNK